MAIAKKLRMTVSSVRHRVQKLVKVGILEFAAVTDPLRIWYQVWALIEVQVELGKIDEAAEQLATMPEVYLVGIIIGRLTSTSVLCSEPTMSFLSL